MDLTPLRRPISLQLLTSDGRTGMRDKGSWVSFWAFCSANKLGIGLLHKARESTAERREKMRSRLGAKTFIMGSTKYGHLHTVTSSTLGKQTEAREPFPHVTTSQAVTSYVVGRARVQGLPAETTGCSFLVVGLFSKIYGGQV